MPIPFQQEVRNRLLALMTPSDFEALAPDLVCMSLPKGFILAEPMQPVTACYFLDSGVGSIVASTSEGFEIESGLFGRDGFGPVGPVMGIDTASDRILIQVADDAWRISAAALITAVDRSIDLRKLLTRYVQVLSAQTGQTALANAMHPIDERLARWLLMIDDRVDGGEFLITHEYLAIMLGVRRPSVTTALHVLQGNGFIRSERGCVLIRDRAALERFAGDIYGRAEAVYARAIGPLRPPLAVS